MAVVLVSVVVAVVLVVTTDFVLRRGDHMREEKELGSVFVSSEAIVRQQMSFYWLKL